MAVCGMRFRYPHVVESLILASAAAERIIVKPRSNPKYDALFAHYLPRMTKIITVDESPRNKGADFSDYVRQYHEIEHQSLFLAAFTGKSLEDYMSQWREQKPLKAQITSKPQIALLAKPFIVLNFGASFGLRCWPLENYLKLAQSIINNGISVVFLGGPSEVMIKQKLSDQLNAFLNINGNARALVSINEFSLDQVATLLAQAQAVVSNDTGIVHMAILMRRPTVCVMGAAQYGPFMPYPVSLTVKETRFIYQLMPCYQCNWQCKFVRADNKIKTFPCIKDISVECVFTALQEILGAENDDSQL